MHAPAAPADDDTDQDVRPDNACVLHRPPDEGYSWKLADQGYRTCSACLDRLRGLMWARDHRAGGTARIAGVSVLYARLNPAPGATADMGGREAPGFHSRSPASEHVIAFRDPRSSQDARVWIDRAGRVCHEDERPPVSVRGELDILAWDVAETLGHDGPHERADVDDLLRFVDVRLDLVTRDADLPVMVGGTLRALQSALRLATGDPRPKYIGHCATILDDLDEQGIPVVCGTRLYAPPRGDLVRCGGCRSEWPREVWEELGKALQAAA